VPEVGCLVSIPHNGGCHRGSCHLVSRWGLRDPQMKIVEIDVHF